MSGHGERRDAVVVGGGHNGLIAAAYLAKAGRDVEVFERDDIPGGAVSTVERFPGHRIDRGSSAHLMIRHSPVLDDLDLASHGLRYVDCDPWAFVPATDTAPAIVFRTDLDATCVSIERSCGAKDAAAYRQFVETWTPRARAVMDAFYRPASMGQFGRAFAGLGSTATTERTGLIGRRSGAMLNLTAELMASGDSLLDRYFDSEQLKAGLAWFGAQSGPPMNAPGTAPMVGFAALMHLIPPGRAIGGSGALTDALVHRIGADGGRIVCGDPAVSITRCGDHWRVQTESGERRCTPTVINACHVLATLDLLAAGGFDAGTIDRWRRDVVVGSGIGMAVRLGTTALPVYRDLPDDLPVHGVHSALGLLVTDRAHLIRAHAAAAVGALPPRPAVVAMSFSAIDPTLAPEGRHAINLWAQWHPYRLASDAGGGWSTLGARAAAAVCDEVDRHAPGFAESIAHRYIQTPEDLESELGLIGGNIMHVEMSIDQMFMWRPTPDLAGHRVPGADGLFLAGASTHPGGGVTGASGYIAGHAALRRRRLFS
ncbi:MULTISPECIES: phytoene desaturase family protein [Gordonia]|uniref:phytoene desaturase family protein n=1 Tax=Gordonia TaxID=2053 RepID=UPI0012BB207D|nr:MULTISPECIES: NAD(P)/FAD-dependent oxidoreductase [Gordonia]MDH3007948.1 NAD(P)/FAD-dependent oxidoreductase [Gordonia alkanivorans]QGP88744.1 FAD-dependent oxidoreductase [Gordonia sp. 135]